MIRLLKGIFQNKIQFLIFSDDAENQGIKKLLKIEGVKFPIFRKKPLLSDLILMSTADLLICSISSMSLLAGFLSSTPYIWFEPHLENIGGLKSIWGHESKQLTGLTALNREHSESESLFGRGVPVGWSGEIGARLESQLWSQLALKNRKRDLLYYGVTE